MIKLRLKFKRGDDLRFLSHLDQQRMFQRALRRAKLPVAFSQGFNPHPILSFANAMSVGMTSESEYCDVGIDLPEDHQALSSELVERLNSVMPRGIEILEAEILPKDAKSLTRMVTGADYDLFCPGFKPATLYSLGSRLDAFNAQEEVKVLKRKKQRKGKKKEEMVEKNIRPNFDSLSLTESPDGPVFHVRVYAVDNSLIKPEMILGAFLKEAGYYALDSEIRVHRKDLILSDQD